MCGKKKALPVRDPLRGIALKPTARNRVSLENLCHSTKIVRETRFFCGDT